MFSDLIRKILQIPGVEVVDLSSSEHSSSRGSSHYTGHHYTLPGNRFKIVSANELDYRQRVQIYELIDAFSVSQEQIESYQSKSHQLINLVNFSCQLLDFDASIASEFEQLFSFITEYGDYAIFRHSKLLASSSIKTQHIEAILMHLEQRSEVRIKSNYGITTAFREQDFTLILVTQQEPEPLLLQMIRTSLEVIEASARAQERLSELKQIESNYATYEASYDGASYSEEDKDTLAEKYQALKRQFEKTLHLAMTDSLTHCLNRRKMEQLLAEQVASCEASEGEFSLIMLDIDHFKSINDTYGHDAGDQVLITLTKLLNKQLRANDQISRWGGEEFIIILPDTSSESAVKLCERLRKKISEHQFSIPQQVTASFGVSTFKQGADLEALLKRVDDALYQAKGSGRNRVVML